MAFTRTRSWSCPSLAKELANFYYNGCHACHKTPCKCDYYFIKEFK